MRRQFTMVAAAAVAVGAALLTGTGGAVAAAHAAATSGGTWRKAEPVPGTVALNTGGFAVTQTVSCGAAGSCSAGGYYTNGAVAQEAFAVTETHGTWGRAHEIAAALNTGGGAAVDSVSCASAGDCSAGGFYSSSGRSQAFVVNEAGGRWEAAREVAATLNKGISAQVNSVSCASVGNCGAGGYYTDGSKHAQAFVVSESSGTWGSAHPVAGALNAGGGAQVLSVSCAAAGACTAAGFFTDRSGHGQAFVVTESRGRWGAAQEVPGTAALNTGGFAEVDAVSCASVGDCSAGGAYTDSSGFTQAFVAGESHGRWGAAQEVPGTVALNKGGHAVVNSVSCASAGNCSAGGQYGPAHAGGAAFVVSETNGTWHPAEQVPGSASLNKGGLAGINSVSCASAGNCSAGGFYTDASANQQAMVVGETNGTWGSAEEVPGTGALNQGSSFGQGRAAVESVSCASPGHCGAGGEYVDGNAAQQAFVDTES